MHGRRISTLAASISLLVVSSSAFVSGASATAAPATTPAETHLAVPAPVLNGVNLDQATIPQIQAAMNKGKFTSVQLTNWYINRIALLNPSLHAVIAIAPNALQEAAASDLRRKHGNLRGQMDGIPVLLKDNIDTNVQPASAGSLALDTVIPKKNSGVAQNLVDGGAVILGKANMSEWAGYRSVDGATGWSGVGGQTANPYVLADSASGSSSGPAAAVAADLATVAVGTETDGSVVSPSGTNSLVGIKPSLGLVSRGGVVPITLAQDTPGPIARNVTDAAILLGAIEGADPRDPITEQDKSYDVTDYTKFLKPGALKGMRIGVWRDPAMIGETPAVDTVYNQAVAQLQALGATTVDIDIPDLDTVNNDEFPAIHYEFKTDINQYLATLPGQHPQNLAGLIQFNLDHASQELQYFDQGIWLSAEATDGVNDPIHTELRNAATDAARAGIDDTLANNTLDAIVAPTNNPAWQLVVGTGQGDAGNLLETSTPAAVSGYADMTVPMGFIGPRPVGLSIMGTDFSESTLISIAYAFQQGTHARQAPTFLNDAPAAPTQ